MNRESLERPFPEALIRTRKGPFGQTFSYVEGAEVIRRLNEALEGTWSFEILEHHVRDTEVVVLGKLTTDGVTKMAFGGSSITLTRDGELVSIADDLKAAATDALKKAASLFGVGLHLYGADRPVEAPSTSRSNGNGQRRASGDSARRGRTGDRSGNGRGANGNGQSHVNSNNGDGQRATGPMDGQRITQRQLSAIWGMARSLGQSADSIRQHTVDAYGVQPEHLSRTDASALITDLGAALGKPAS